MTDPLPNPIFQPNFELMTPYPHGYMITFWTFDNWLLFMAVCSIHYHVTAIFGGFASFKHLLLVFGKSPQTLGIMDQFEESTICLMFMAFT